MKKKSKTALVFLALCVLGGCSSPPLRDEAQLRQAADPERITARLHAQRHLFESCKQVYGSEKLSGTLTVRFKIRSDGSTSQPHIFETIGQSASLDRCLTDATLRLAFDPMPAGVVADIEYPIRFTRDEALTRQPATSTRRD